MFEERFPLMGRERVLPKPRPPRELPRGILDSTSPPGPAVTSSAAPQLPAPPLAKGDKQGKPLGSAELWVGVRWVAAGPRVHGGCLLTHPSSTHSHFAQDADDNTWIREKIPMTASRSHQTTHARALRPLLPESLGRLRRAGAPRESEWLDRT